MKRMRLLQASSDTASLKNSQAAGTEANILDPNFNSFDGNHSDSLLNSIDESYSMSDDEKLQSIISSTEVIANFNYT